MFSESAVFHAMMRQGRFVNNGDQLISKDSRVSVKA
jgi:hypothetical protein